MSFCYLPNRNGDHGQSENYFRETGRKLRRFLQFWLANNLTSPWMYIDPLQNAIETDALLYPLALIDVNHQRKLL